DRTPLRKAGWVVTSCTRSPSIHTSRGRSLSPVMYSCPVRAGIVLPPSRKDATHGQDTNPPSGAQARAPAGLTLAFPTAQPVPNRLLKVLNQDCPFGLPLLN